VRIVAVFGRARFSDVSDLLNFRKVFMHRQLLRMQLSPMAFGDVSAEAL
jgi:hypothetical protein